MEPVFDTGRAGGTLSTNWIQIELFHVCLNYMYMSVCTLHFCIARFEGKITELIDSKSVGPSPTPKSGGPDSLPFPP